MMTKTVEIKFKLYVTRNENDKDTLFMTVNGKDSDRIMLSSVHRIRDEISGNNLGWHLNGFNYKTTYHESIGMLLDYASKQTETLISCYLSHISNVY